MRIPKLLRFVPLFLVLLLFINGSPVAQGNSNQFGVTDNPIEVGPPIIIPPTHPITVPILLNQAYDNAVPPITTAVTLPASRAEKVILTITGTEQGRQYDRLLLIWAGTTQIFAGVTPEPTATGITWKVQKDITAYLPLLHGAQNITTELDNYVTSTYTGVPVISTQLAFYPAENSTRQARNTWDLPSPDAIVSINAQPAMSTLQTGGTLTSTVKLPHDILSVYMDLYAIGQSNDEFWWSNQPSFREVEVSIDGRPAGVVWPVPYIYTGGVNPYLWRPITAIRTLDLPAYRLDLTPFAGLLGGTHTVSIQVANNQGYWLLAGSLFLYENHGKPTTGSITSNTLTFPTQASTTTTNILGSSSNTLLNLDADAGYTIQGNILSGGEHWIASVNSTLRGSNDQTNISPGYWQLVHGLQMVTTKETMTEGRETWQRQSEDSYTLDAASAYLQTSNNANAFFLPANVTQMLDEVHSASGPGFDILFHRSGFTTEEAYHSSLHEIIQGYAALQSGVGATVANGATTAYADFEDSSGRDFHELLEARGGTVTLKHVTDTHLM